MDIEDNQFIKSLQQQLICPISRSQMTDPVITADGITYQRQAIAQWFKNQHKSPITNLPLQNTNLIPNIAFRNLTQKLSQGLHEFLAKQQSYKTQISQLKQEIQFLRQELNHQKTKVDQLLEKEQKQIKTKRIQKQRHEHKYEQLRLIRDQKNIYQKQLQQLKSKQQQQNRQIRLLKQQLHNVTDRFQKSAAGQRKYMDLYKKVQRNRNMILHKLEFSFVSNLTFIGHLLQSIQDAKNIEAQLKQKEKTSLQTIAIEQSPIKNNKQLQNTQNYNIIQRLQQIIRAKVNGDDLQQKSAIRIRRYQGIRRLNLNGFPPVPLHLRFRRIQRNQQRIIQNNANNNDNQAAQNLPNQQPIQLQNQNQQQQNIQQNNHQNARPSLSDLFEEQAIQNQDNDLSKVHIRRDSQLYRQLLSIKWMMSKRNYRQIPQFYNYQVCKNHENPQTYWFGVKISVLQSQIPFVEFLPHSWNHVRWLDLSSCNVDDELWQKFVKNSRNFSSLMYINLNRNKIQKIKKQDIQKFPCLIRFSIQRNKLNKDSEQQLKKYMQENPKKKVEYKVDEIEGMEQELYDGFIAE